MTAAVIFLWTSCLWSIARGVLCLLWTASPWRRMLVLTVVALALANCRTPEEMRKNNR